VTALADADGLPALYDAEVVHSRMERIRRTFTHRIYLWLVDLDALPDLPRWLRPFGRFEAADHLGAPDRSIRENLDSWLASRGVDLQDGRVVMLTNARSLGYVFNPITLYWCSRPDGRPECVVAEVHNTYGERHCYLLRPDTAGAAETAKEFYVSPFLASGGAYQMHVSRPGRHLAVTIALRQHGQTVFAVRLSGTRNPATRLRFVRTFLRHPFGSYRISALIRLHGIRLWLARIPVLPRSPHLPHKGIQ